MMKRCTKDNLEFPDDRRFCATCGAVLVEDCELTTLIMPRMKLNQAEFIEMDDDQTFKFFIHDKTYKLSMDEVKTLAAEIHATVGVANLCWAISEN